MIRGKKWAVIAVSLSAMLVFLSACSAGSSKSTTDNSSHPQTSTSGDKGSTDPSKQPEVTLTVFSTLANYAGDQPGWFAKLIKDKFNIKLNIIASNLAGGQQKIGTMMASGDLGDIVVGLGGRDYTDAIKAGMLLDWKKDGMLDKYGKDITKYASKALDANSKQFGSGTAIYGIGHNVGSGSGPSEGADMTFGPMLRWDLYQKLGKSGNQDAGRLSESRQANAAAQSEERFRQADVRIFAVVGLGPQLFDEREGHGSIVRLCRRRLIQQQRPDPDESQRSEMARHARRQQLLHARPEILL